MGNSYPWFINEWLTVLERQCTSSDWRRAQHYVQDEKVNVQLGLGQLEGFVRDDSQYQINVSSTTFSSQDMDAIVAIYQEEPRLLFLVYQRHLSEEDVKPYPNSLGFAIPQMNYQCSCGNPDQPCAHTLAALLQAAEDISDDYIKYLQLGGLDWNQVIGYTSSDVNDLETTSVPEGEYGLIHRAAPQSIPHPRQPLDVPPFWTSSFSYRLMMQEIFVKAKEEKRERRISRT